jgi:RND family efflux transporter MFP subunit
MDGKILERKVAVGDRVTAGDVIALVDPSEVGKKFLPNPVESTVSGTVLSFPLHEGDTVSTSTAIATIGDISRVQIVTWVPERYISSLKGGTAAVVTFDAIPKVSFTARISEINPIVDMASRTIKIKLRFDQLDARVLVGMSASVKLLVEELRNVVMAPREAIAQDTGEGAYVFVVKSDNTVERRTVVLGAESETSFEIKKGLSPGEKVVTEGRNSVKDGSRVRAGTSI